MQLIMLIHMENKIQVCLNALVTLVEKTALIVRMHVKHKYKHVSKRFLHFVTISTQLDFLVVL